MNPFLSACALIFIANSSQSPSPIPGEWLLGELIDHGKLHSTMTFGLTAESQGRVLATGRISDAATPSHAVIRSSSDFGATWTNLKVNQEAPGNVSFGKDIAVDSRGRVSVLVGVQNAEQVRRWQVLRSNPERSRWDTVVDYAPFQGGYHYPYHLLVGPNDAVYVAGFIQDHPDPDQATQTHWVVQRIESDGSWKVIQQLPFALARGISIDSRGAIYVSGSQSNVPAGGSLKDATASLMTQKSENDGETWSLVDDWDFGGAMGSGAISNFVDSNNWIFSVGSWTQSAGTPRRAFLRRSKDGGKTWQDLPGFSLSEAGNSEIYQVVEDRKRGLHGWVGYAVDDEGVYHWIIRVSRNGGDTWTTELDYKGQMGQGGYGHNLSVSPDGDWYSAGSSLRSGDRQDSAWTVIRKTVVGKNSVP